MTRVAVSIAVCALSAGLTALPSGCAAPVPEVVEASTLSSSEIDERIGVLQSEIASDRTQIATLLSERRGVQDTQLSDDPDFRALADRLVEREQQLDRLEAEKAARAARHGADRAP